MCWDDPSPLAAYTLVGETATLFKRPLPKKVTTKMWQVALLHTGRAEVKYDIKETQSGVDKPLLR